MRRKTIIRKNRERRELTVERTVAIPTKLAWEGWTQPEHITRWWGPKNWTTTVYEMDVRPGGVWRYSLKSDDNSGEEAYCRAVYEEVEAPRKLVYTETLLLPMTGISFPIARCSRQSCSRKELEVRGLAS
ncbi:SRPBCC domain-containing protein [Paenibacillus chitinolyticus]|uniref:SRPBCC domain-containing protein n=1 Tax=Paenibacillus chitinolyticus TaxID=79263 RepID=UPI0020D07DA7|nr:SRPBCC domain-containing protein [Paenibacillus chitinolyticus]